MASITVLLWWMDGRPGGSRYISASLTLFPRSSINRCHPYGFGFASLFFSCAQSRVVGAGCRGLERKVPKGGVERACHDARLTDMGDCFGAARRIAIAIAPGRVQ